MQAERYNFRIVNDAKEEESDALEEVMVLFITHKRVGSKSIRHVGSVNKADAGNYIQWVRKERLKSDPI